MLKNKKFGIHWNRVLVLKTVNSSLRSWERLVFFWHHTLMLLLILKMMSYWRLIYQILFHFVFFFQIRPGATCVATLHDSVDHEFDISHVIIGTESRELLILAPNSAKLLLLLQLPCLPSLIAVEGEYTVEYRIVIGFRDGSIGICRLVDAFWFKHQSVFLYLI